MTTYDAITDGFLAAWSERVTSGKSQPLSHDERLVALIFAAWMVERYDIKPRSTCESVASNGKVKITTEGNNLGVSMGTRQTVSQ